MTIREDDLSGAPTQALLAFHLFEMRAASLPGQAFALDLSCLQAPDVIVWTAWDGEALAGVGALRTMEGFGEINPCAPTPTACAAAWLRPCSIIS